MEGKKTFSTTTAPSMPAFFAIVIAGCFSASFDTRPHDFFMLVYLVCSASDGDTRNTSLRSHHDASCHSPAKLVTLMNCMSSRCSALTETR